MEKRLKEWTITFNDLKEGNPCLTDDYERTNVENKLRAIFRGINQASGGNNGHVEIDELKLLREGESYEYTVYISLTNPHSGGYCRMMFD